MYIWMGVWMDEGINGLIHLDKWVDVSTQCKSMVGCTDG